jgi:hypothetical protein
MLLFFGFMTSLSLRCLSRKRRCGEWSALRSWIKLRVRMALLAGSTQPVGRSSKWMLWRPFETLWRGDARGLHMTNPALIALLPKRADTVEVKNF